MLRFETLEAREVPAHVLFAASGGVVYERVGELWEYRATAFEGGVPATLSADGEHVYVGAGPGGAPRVVTYNRGWTATESVFVGNPESRAGVSLVGFDRPSAGLTSTDPVVQSYLNRIPPLSVDLSATPVHVYSPGTVYDVPGVPKDALGYYQPADKSIHIRADFAALSVHEAGHAVADALGLLGAQESAGTAEDYAWSFYRWVNGEANAQFDGLLAHDFAPVRV